MLCNICRLPLCGFSSALPATTKRLHPYVWWWLEISRPEKRRRAAADVAGGPREFHRRDRARLPGPGLATLAPRPRNPLVEHDVSVIVGLAPHSADGKEKEKQILLLKRFLSFFPGLF